jgi:hypothetical protein
MRNATLASTAPNELGYASTAMVWYNEANENEIIQLTIGDYKYIFNNEGKLQSTSEVQTCANDNSRLFVCAQFPPSISCIPCENISGDRIGQVNNNYDVDTEQKKTGKSDAVINEKNCPDSKGQTFDIKKNAIEDNDE